MNYSDLFEQLSNFTAVFLGIFIWKLRRGWAVVRAKHIGALTRTLIDRYVLALSEQHSTP